MKISRIHNADGSFTERLVHHIQFQELGQLMSILRNTDPCSLTNNDGETLLHVAAKYGNVWFVQHLIKLGANVDAQSNSKESPLMYAVTYLQFKAARALLKANASIFLSDLRGECALKKAFDIKMAFDRDLDRDLEVCPKKLSNIDNIKVALLNRVTIESLKNSRHVDSKLFYANCPLYMFMKLKNVEMTRFLLENGCAVDAQNPEYGGTALHMAVKRMDIDNVKLLLEYGADVNRTNFWGNTALARLCDFKDQDKALQMFDILEAAGATMIDYDNRKIFVEHLLLRGNKEIVRRVLAHRIDLNFMGERDTNALASLAANPNPGVLAELSDFDFDVNNIFRDEDSEPTILHIAAGRASADSIQFLLDRGAEVNVTSDEGFTALTNVIAYWFERDNDLDARVECVEILLAAGADPQFVNELNCLDGGCRFDRQLSDSRIKLVQPVLAYLPLVELSGREITHIMQRDVLSVPQFKEFFDAKKIELEEMKQIELGKSVTLLDFLMAGDDKISLYARNRSFTTASFSELIKEGLESCYRRRLDVSFLKWTKLVKLRTKAAMVIDNIFVKLYNISVHNVTEKIIDYLEDDEIHNILKIIT